MTSRLVFMAFVQGLLEDAVVAYLAESVPIVLINEVVEVVLAEDLSPKLFSHSCFDHVATFCT